ncbi:MAG: SIMPL domain-containing protein [Bacteroidaceae bacterium]|nr:SIMPL domain-containing protein [Bacteroidaceae bacterium]
MKKEMIIIGKVVAIVAIMLTAPFTLSAQNEVPNIDMQAEAQREVTPDELYLSIIIKESDYKGKKTLQQQQDAMIGVLKANRIDVPECLTLDYMGSSVNYKTFSKRMVPRSSASYMLKLSDATIMQKIIYELEEIDITNIQLTKTRFTKEEQLITELGMEAMQKAQRQATAYAGAVGQSIGKAIRISSWNTSSSPQPRLYKSRNAMMVEESAADTSIGALPESISISKLTYTVHVNVKFELN